MLEKFKNNWKTATFVATVVVVVSSFLVQTMDMAYAKAKVDSHDLKLDKLTQIAEGLQDPNKWMLDFLINHNIDSTTAKEWAYSKKGPFLDSNGKPKNNLPFISKEKYLLPDIGLLMMYRNDSLTLLDTLCNFKKKNE